MAETLTKKRLTDVVIIPLDVAESEAVNLVLYGLKSERVSFRVLSPSKRNVGHGTVTQQRRVSRRRFTLEFTLFEQSITKRIPTTDEQLGQRVHLYQQTAEEIASPARPSVYRMDSQPDTRLTTKQQLDLIHRLAKLHEKGALIAYHGVIVDLRRAAIVEFDAEAVYTTGRGTITIEERTEAPFDLSLRAVSVEAVEAALRNLKTATFNGDMDESMSKVTNRTLTQDEHRHQIEAWLIGGAARGSSYGPVRATNRDPSTLRDYGLDCLPIIIANTPTDQRQIFPATPDGTAPKVSIVVLDDSKIRKSAVDPNAFQYARFELGVTYGEFWIKFIFQTTYNHSWTVEAQVYPSQNYNSADPRDDVPGQTDADCPAPSRIQSPSSDPTKPLYVTKQAVVYGQEWQLAEGLTFAFVGAGGKNPFEGKTTGRGAFEKPSDFPRSTEIGQYALVIADYST